MNIALDYDGTYTSDPALWYRFAVTARTRGHNVMVVTMRYPSEANSMDDNLLRLCPTFFTSRKAKRPYMQAQGQEIHIWIDDNPEAVVMDATEIWDDIAPEGCPVVPVHE